MGKSYNVSLDSNYCTKQVNSNASNQFYVNWPAIMPDKPYKVSWSCITTVEAGLDTQVMGCCINLGNSSSTVSTSTGSISSSFIGFFELKDTGATHFYYADQATNPPVYIDGRPNQMMLSVLFTFGIDATSVYSTPYPGNYVLTLHFEEQ